MKSQTKALLASVMVLALALSSIGGVTYSWFSDTETKNIQISTATIDVTSSIGATGNVSINDENIIITPNSTGTINVTGTNNSSFPVDVAVKIVHIQQGVLLEGQSTYTNVCFDIDQDSNIDLTSEPTEKYWYDSYIDLLFGSATHTNPETGATTQGDKMTFVKSMYPGIPESSNKKMTDGRTFTDIRLLEYQYKEEVTVDSNANYSFSIRIATSNLFNEACFNNLKIIVEVTQSSSFLCNIDNAGHGGIIVTDIIRTRSILFIGEGITVEVEKEALVGVSKVSLDYNNIGNSGTVTLTFYNENGSVITPGIDGSVTMVFNSGSILGSITAPASERTYTFTVGESSS